MKVMSKRNVIALLVVLDLIAVGASWVLSCLLTEGQVFSVIERNILFLLIGALGTVLINYALGAYEKLWKYVGFMDAVRVEISAFCYGVFNVLVSILVKDELGLDWAVLTTFIYFFILGVTRFANRFYSIIVKARKKQKHENKRILIAGAGDACLSLIREMQQNEGFNMIPVCVLDDNKNKLGMEIYGVKVVGKTSQAEKFAEEYNIDEIIVAMPSATPKQLKKVIENCKTSNRKVMILPSLTELAGSEVSVKNVKAVQITDLLGREQIKVNLDEIMGYIKDKTVLVTGGGGSIGSELCRQIASHSPKQLIIVDIYENNAYDIQQELIRKHPELNLTVLIASVRDRKRIETIFGKYKPEIVFHAAAHKHVPLMEVSPCEAVKNNVGGTFKVADVAGVYGVKKFILISTDKAVNPTNVMGATKRICEMIIQSMNKKYDTDYVAVRFGNVLGSNGSVIPLFKQQIEEGGPVTVTHKDIVRYFMTIPEAVSLVLQAGAYAHGGEIFVLDMGEPVKIYDLAVNLIKLSGLKPDVDIEIKVTGLRPGEKLYEERLMEEEGLEKTQNKLISIGKPLVFDEKSFFDNVKELYDEAYTETDKIKEAVAKIVTTYKIDKREN